MDMESALIRMAANSLELIFNSDHRKLSGADKVITQYQGWYGLGFSDLVSALFRCHTSTYVFGGGPSLTPDDEEWQFLMSLVGEIRRNGYDYEATTIKKVVATYDTRSYLRDMFLASAIALLNEVRRGDEVYDMAQDGEHSPSCKLLTPLDGFEFEVGFEVTPTGGIQRHDCEYLHRYFLKKMMQLPLHGRSARQKANSLLYLMTAAQTVNGTNDVQWALNQVHKDVGNDEQFIDAIIIGGH